METVAINLGAVRIAPAPPPLKQTMKATISGCTVLVRPDFFTIIRAPAEIVMLRAYGLADALVKARAHINLQTA